ncbi:polyphosphate kinase 1 [Algiphilus sp.]|uniref:polyphosphate kinase 1 n=2 Tax=Algiphilus sp. TaxID=1872431 RepID=UPI002A659F4A|nr:polyphosphate kinase 1 [Pseudomonadota bacterium]
MNTQSPSSSKVETLAAETTDMPDLTAPELYINRELSLLAFNRRVLEQALDESIPLLERLKFVCIASSNLDEFFEIRVAGLKKMAELNPNQRGADGQPPQELLREIADRAHELVDEQYRIFNDILLPSMQDKDIRFLRRSEWTTEQDTWLAAYFHEELMPVLSPLGLDPAHPFPRILNKSLNFIVQLQGKDAFGRNSGFAIVQAPRALPRLIQIPREIPGSGPSDFVFLSSVIHAYVDDLFPGMQATGCYQFRITRNSDLLVDEEETEDLLEALEGELAQRQWGDAVRLEVAQNCPEHLWRYLMETVQLSPADVYQVNGPVNLNRLMALPDLIDRPELKYPAFTPRVHKGMAQDVFNTLRERDVLVHHPFDSFAPVLEFLRQAARDPNVLAIKQTLYRTGAKSPVVDALIEAARAGKEVTVVVELRARFDEAENIDLAEALQEVGAHVVYGVVGYKTHAKMSMVVRREESGLRQYVHLGTGNYHPKTARLYTDYGLFTADTKIGHDVHNLFLQLTSLGKVTQMHRLLHSPFTLQKCQVERIDREAENHRAGRPARIRAKMNALVDAQMIQALYRASCAGVPIELVVRGMCCLRPGIPGVSENIRVISVVGRFLEHTRVFCFENGGEPEVWLSSADWMERNLYKRVETAFPVLDARLRTRVINELQSYIDDRARAWQLNADGSYTRIGYPDEANPGAQQMLLDAATAS